MGAFDFDFDSQTDIDHSCPHTDINMCKYVFIKLMTMFDVNRDKQLDFEEFTSLFEFISNKYRKLQLAKEKFASLDKDKSGFLEGKEIDELTEWTVEVTFFSLFFCFFLPFPCPSTSR
jgi:hypothetical protein